MNNKHGFNIAELSILFFLPPDFGSEVEASWKGMHLHVSQF